MHFCCIFSILRCILWSPFLLILRVSPAKKCQGLDQNQPQPTIFQLQLIMLPVLEEELWVSRLDRISVLHELRRHLPWISDRLPPVMWQDAVVVWEIWQEVKEKSTHRRITSP